MGVMIDIEIDENGKLDAELNDSATARTIAASLPMTIRLSRWGDEYYGDCGVTADLEPGARTRMAVGEIAYWPPGRALCLFFGPTPASRGQEPEAASMVNPVGKIISDCTVLKKKGGTLSVTVKKKS